MRLCCRSAGCDGHHVGGAVRSPIMSGRPKNRKVQFNFDERSLDSVERLREQGFVTPEMEAVLEAEERQKIKDWEWYFKELMSEQCACEKSKRRGHSFCYAGYTALPKELRKALWRRIGLGYEEAYEEAHKYLEENVW